MIAIIDYGVGNLFSLQSSLEFIGADAVITSDPQVIRDSDKIILPGVGAFSDAIKKLVDKGLDKIIKEEVAKGKPLLGICLGMQMLFETSYEYGQHKGLGLIKGDITYIGDNIPKDLKIPHIGWNKLILPTDKEKSKLYKYLNPEDCVYFVHSYSAVQCSESVTAMAEYGGMLTASVESGNVYGVQYHPEKSGQVGLGILRGFNQL